MSAKTWKFTAICCWCNSVFVRLEIDGARVWACPTQDCRERQLKWRLDDDNGKLMYLPMPRQCELEESIASQSFDSICAGGHRSGGKSRALRMIAYRYCRTIEKFSVLFLRREWEQLRLNHMRFAAQEALRFGTKLSSKKIEFPTTGAELTFHHMEDPRDFESFIGAEFDLVIFDQLELFTREQFVETGAATSRIQRDNWRGLALAGENPGGPLSAFVSELFIKKDLDRTKYPDYNPTVHHFIEFKIEDNPYTDERYEQRLALLSPERREMFRFGRRDVFPSQFFKEFKKAEHITTDVQLIGAKYCGSLEWGFNETGHALIWAILPTRHLYIRACIRLEQLHEDAAVAAMNTMATMNGLRRMPITYGAPSIFAKRDDADRVIGQTVAESLQYAGLTLAEGDGDLENGWARCHAILRNDPQGIPWLRIHPSCEDLISALSTAMSDEADADLVDKQSPMLSALHALRIGAMSRPAPDHAKPQPITYPPGTAGYMLREAMKEARASV